MFILSSRCKSVREKTFHCKLHPGKLKPSVQMFELNFAMNCKTYAQLYKDMKFIVSNGVRFSFFLFFFLNQLTARFLLDLPFHQSLIGALLFRKKKNLPCVFHAEPSPSTFTYFFRLIVHLVHDLVNLHKDEFFIENTSPSASAKCHKCNCKCTRAAIQ